MILKQVHDTNMRAKGYPERVFSVGHTPESCCRLCLYAAECPLHTTHVCVSVGVDGAAGVELCAALISILMSENRFS